jgi:hypothetical protein
MQNENEFRSVCINYVTKATMCLNLNQTFFCFYKVDYVSIKTGRPTRHRQISTE